MRGCILRHQQPPLQIRHTSPQRRETTDVVLRCWYGVKAIDLHDVAFAAAAGRRQDCSSIVLECIQQHGARQNRQLCSFNAKSQATKVLGAVHNQPHVIHRSFPPIDTRCPTSPLYGDAGSTNELRSDWAVDDSTVRGPKEIFHHLNFFIRQNFRPIDLRHRRPCQTHSNIKLTAQNTMRGTPRPLWMAP